MFLVSNVGKMSVTGANASNVRATVLGRSSIAQVRRLYARCIGKGDSVILKWLVRCSMRPRTACRYRTMACTSFFLRESAVGA